MLICPPAAFSVPLKTPVDHEHRTKSFRLFSLSLWPLSHRKQREKNKKNPASKYSAAPGKVVPVEVPPDAAATTANANAAAPAGDTANAIAKEFDSSGAAAAVADGGAEGVARLEEGGAGDGGGAGGAGGGPEALSPLVVPGVSPEVAARQTTEEPHW